MRSGPTRSAAVAGAVLALAASGCSHLRGVHWPWQHAPAPPPAPVHELDISGSGADAFRQLWKRNTLVVDLRAASGAGSIVLKPVAGGAWPVRLAFTVTPGAIGVLEVRADQRVQLPITSAGPPIDLELAPRIYSAKTAQMTVSWGAGGASAP